MEVYGEVGDSVSIGEYRCAAADGSWGECRFDVRPPEGCD